MLESFHVRKLTTTWLCNLLNSSSIVLIKIIFTYLDNHSSQFQCFCLMIRSCETLQILPTRSSFFVFFFFIIFPQMNALVYEVLVQGTLFFKTVFYRKIIAFFQISFWIIHLLKILHPHPFNGSVLKSHLNYSEHR